MPTIKEIAEIAGVSPSTVSNVINGHTNKMRPDTLAKVQKILKQENYVSNMGGRLLAKNGSRLIVLIMTYTRREEKNAVQDPFFSELIGALEQEIRELGYFMILYTSSSAEESLRMVDAWNVEGIILQGCAPWDCSTYMKNTHIPLVFIDTYFEEGGEKFINIGLEDKRGGELVAEHLIEQGHKRIAFLLDEQYPFGVDAERLKGFMNIMKKHEIQFSSKDDFYVFSYRKKEREAYFKEFAKTHLHKYTALCFASDFYAADVVNTFRDIGVDVPEQVSICGFDDNIFASTCRPMLTTVRQDVTEKAKLAVNRLMQMIRNEPIEEKDTKLPVELVVRDSIKRMKQ
ncbi:LacI family DNA-binding transcriptional regulator [Kineothrix sp. MB12-C1]|uniref:LacI family DNA-binding transcriptional regulator n=1 Tax=Kineothrix sp. MB12-C1 TaxID=3070215 RepID=UPI0027D34260|nr:LacI family DNA-binding transcriptional regulator [Kineothrix sp. MB12-C1]WMC91851.1 LacI family DNA-binding transcriptional regulator [Kineothrix sp. MB12-C1]